MKKIKMKIILFYEQSFVIILNSQNYLLIILYKIILISEPTKKEKMKTIFFYGLSKHCDMELTKLLIDYFVQKKLF